MEPTFVNKPLGASLPIVILTYNVSFSQTMWSNRCLLYAIVIWLKKTNTLTNSHTDIFHTNFDMGPDARASTTVSAVTSNHF